MPWSFLGVPADWSSVPGPKGVQIRCAGGTTCHSGARLSLLVGTLQVKFLQSKRGSFSLVWMLGVHITSLYTTLRQRTGDWAYTLKAFIIRVWERERKWERERQRHVGVPDNVQLSRSWHELSTSKVCNTWSFFPLNPRTQRWSETHWSSC